MNANAAKVKRFRKAQQQKVRDLKEASPCADCGHSFPYYVMDYHHRDAADKEFKLSRALSNTMAWSRILAEVAKCDLLCANCHRVREHEHRRVFQ